jgi:hypothetical protein
LPIQFFLFGWAKYLIADDSDLFQWQTRLSKRVENGKAEV